MPSKTAFLIGLAVLAGAALEAQEADRQDPRPGATAARDRTLAVASRAFERFRHGLRSGEWQGFLEMLADDFVLQFPAGRWRGRHQGKAKAAEFFAYVKTIFPEGIELELERVSAGDTTVVFEFHDWGRLALPGQPARDYTNRVAISLDVKGDQIVGYREYFGDIAN